MHMKINKKIITILGISISLLSFSQQESSRSFSLFEAQEYAVNNNLDILNARLDIDIAKKKIWETTAIGLPQATTSLGHNYMLDIPVTLVPAKMFDPNAGDDDLAPLKFGTDHNTKFDIQVNQIIFSGEYIVGLQASKIYKQLSENQLEKSIQNTKELIANTYELSLIASERIIIIQKNLKNTQGIFKDTKALFESGFSESTDVDQIQISISTLSNALSSAKRQINLVHNLLKFQMNIPLEETIILTDNLETLLNKVNYTDLISRNMDQSKHIDFKTILTQVHLQKLNLRREKSTFLPTISAFYNHQQNMMGNEFKVLNGGEWFPTNIVGLNIQMPIFTSGQRISKVSQARIEFDKANNNKEMVSKNLDIQLLKARSEFEDANDKFKVEKENKALAERIFNNYKIKYKSGLASSLELTQSQLQLLGTEDAYFQAIFSLLENKTKLEKALGEL